MHKINQQAHTPLFYSPVIPEALISQRELSHEVVTHDVAKFSADGIRACPHAPYFIYVSYA